MNIQKDLHGCKFTLADNGPTENPLESLYLQATGEVRDMSLDRKDAWRYGIIAGWGDESYKELAIKHNWSSEDVSRNKRLHKKYIQAWKFIQDAP